MRWALLALFAVVAIPVGLYIIGAIVLNIAGYRQFTIPFASMEPTLEIGDTAWAAPVGADDPLGRGDVVVFKRQGADYVMRVIGLGGDTVHLREGVIHLNGEPVVQRGVGERADPMSRGAMCLSEEDRDGETMCLRALVAERLDDRIVTHLNSDDNTTRQDNTRVFDVPADKLFLMGDNRDNSNDSRGGVGLVDRSAVSHRMWLITVSVDPSDGLRADRTLTRVR